MTIPSDRQPSAAEQATLFDLPPAEPPVPAAPAGVGRPRLRRANRDQIVHRALPTDALLPADHAARTIRAYVQGLDLSTLYDAIASVHGGSGRAATDPGILLALWLYATADGVGSARDLDRLCRDHAAYRRIAGDVPMNHHTLADFRTDHVELLDDLLTGSVATPMAEGLIDLNRVARDGMRVRADAGAASFRRRPTLDEALAQAEAQAEALRAEAEGDPTATGPPYANVVADDAVARVGRVRPGSAEPRGLPSDAPRSLMRLPGSRESRRMRAIRDGIRWGRDGRGAPGVDPASLRRPGRAGRSGARGATEGPGCPPARPRRRKRSARPGVGAFAALRPV